MQEQPNYFSVIPASVRNDKRLPASAQLLYGDISSLTKSEGFCYASNAWFATKLNFSIRTVSKLVTCLQQAGHIRVEILNRNQRRIWLMFSRPPTNKTSIPLEEKFHPPGRKVLHSSKESSTESKNTYSVSPGAGVRGDVGGHPGRQAFLKRWGAAYEDFFGEDYKDSGKRDEKAAEGLLALKNTDPESLLMVARKAWARRTEFNCKHAVSLSGFASRFNEIRGELGLLGRKVREGGF